TAIAGALGIQSCIL
ncbi:DUF6486 family protein, partial [Parabacteroides distasonis]